MKGRMASFVLVIVLVTVMGCSRSSVQEDGSEGAPVRGLASSLPADAKLDACSLVDRETIRNVLGIDFVREERGGSGLAPCSFQARGLGLVEFWPRVDPTEYERIKQRLRAEVDVSTEVAMDEAFYVRTTFGSVARDEDKYAIVGARKGARAVQLRLLAPELHDDDARRVTIALAKLSFAKL